MKKFRFYIDGILVHPSYKMSQAREWKAEQNQAFYRPSLTEAFTILDPDYSIIENADIEHEFTFVCEELTSTAGPTWTNFFTGYFTKFDITEIDEDHRWIKLKPLSNDRYRKLLDGLEKEINIIDLNISKSTIKYRRYPLLQVYLVGINSAKLINYSNGNIFEANQDVRLEKNELEDEGFVRIGDDTNSISKLFVFADTGNITHQATGAYVFTGDGDLQGLPFRDYAQEGGTYTIRWQDSSLEDLLGLFIIRDSNDDLVYVGSNNSSSGNIVTMANEDDYPGESLNLIIFQAYARIVCDVETEGTVTTAPIQDDWQVESYGRSKYRTGADFSQVLVTMNFDHTATDNGFGQVTADPAVQFIGDYYNKSGATKRWPIAESYWHDVSFWLTTITGIPQTADDLLEELVEVIELADAYRMDRLIFAMLQEIDPVLTHQNIPAFSNFLYNSTNPLTNESQGQYYFTDKSNILNPDYDKAATKVIVKLKDLLRAQYLIFFGLQYDITNLSNFRIEHEFYYDKGLSYSNDLIGADITSLIEPHSRKTWDTNTKKWAYEKPDIPGFIKRIWSDDVSNFFNGIEIEIISAYAEKERRDEEGIPLVITDIDYMISNPSGVSNNGLLMIEVDSDGFVNEYETLNDLVGLNQKHQNGSLSMTVLQERFGRYQLPAKNVKINNVATTALSLKKTTKQKIRIKLNQYLNPAKLILTSKGKGKIETLRQIMRTGENRIDIKHDSEI